jgi:hypothetical protein
MKTAALRASQIFRESRGAHIVTNAVITGNNELVGNNWYHEQN